MPAQQDIAAVLRNDILKGRVAPGEELRQEALAKRFDVSRMPIRDALNMLAAERLVALRPNRGAQVIALSADEIAEIYDLRLLLECDLLRRSIPAMTRADLADIRREMQRCEIEAGAPDFPAADWRFHLALYAPSKRQRHIALVEELRSFCQMHRAAYDSLRQRNEQWSADHRQLAAEVENGQTDAAINTLRAHIQSAGSDLTNWMKTNTAQK